MAFRDDFLGDYLLYNSGNMCPPRYHLWCAISLLAMAAGRRVYFEHGDSERESYFRITPMLYITLVGRQGLRKSTAKDIARGIFTECFPDYPIGASVMSREKIVERLASDDVERIYTDETGTTISWKPMAFFVNELKNFMSIDPAKMVEFLTDVYDQKFFDAGTIKHGLQAIINPYINILACETPKWVIERLKLNIIAGGFSRRMIYAYETTRPPRITFPFKTTDMIAAGDRCREHLQKLVGLAGRFSWDSPTTKDFFDKWFKELPSQDDEILEGWYEAKDTIILKLAMLLALAKRSPCLVLTRDLIIDAIGIINETIEDNLAKLTIASGRNEAAVAQSELLEHLRKNGGLVPKKFLERDTNKFFRNYMEQTLTIRHLKETGQIFERVIQVNGIAKTFVICEDRYLELRKKGEILD